MQEMQLLNVDGCGVCTKANLIKMLDDQKKKGTGWRKYIFKIIHLFKKQSGIKLLPWCTHYKKYVDPMHKCLHYKPKKQIKIWGNKVDEEIPFDNQMLERKGIIIC